MSSVNNTKNEENLDFSVMWPILQKILNVKTQEDLAKRLGIKAQAVSNAKAKNKMSIKWIHRLAQHNFISWNDMGKFMDEGRRRLPTPEEPAIKKPPLDAPIAPVSHVERRRYHKLRAMINAISRCQKTREGLPELIALGLPNITSMTIRQIHKDNGLMISPLDNS